MESETSVADAKAQLSALAEAEDAASVEGCPPDPSWFRYVAALIGPISVAMDVLDEPLNIASAVIGSAVIVGVSIWQMRKPRVRKSHRLYRGRFGASQMAFIFVMLVSMQFMEPLSRRLDPWLLTVASYLGYVAYFGIWTRYTNSVVTRRTQGGPQA